MELMGPVPGMEDPARPGDEFGPLILGHRSWVMAGGVFVGLDGSWWCVSRWLPGIHSLTTSRPAGRVSCLTLLHADMTVTVRCALTKPAGRQRQLAGACTDGRRSL
ncbi:hypothetical protein GCM10010372_51840 [Streptomyces tauricus]|nr:hypothetical protein GCM10010372_51840 [Streptomyces tauricus]